ncbi:dicarboxylate/amino acid:cation (Na or H) symporter (DAACS) family protein [Thraustotheca clavata]|uniref:Amino acid transporter n=1 Tax=Thraustotheca clavata TaxID=74557 RepID=A0A1W0A417_9STRA|nr:dicarboxylate/amino acid:cation (Na or H) symporter (DAACS) family protein [Thraustotheca clavata]
MDTFSFPMQNNGVVLFSAAGMASTRAERFQRISSYSQRNIKDSCRRPTTTSVARTDYTSDSRAEYELIEDGSISPILQEPPPPQEPPLQTEWRILSDSPANLIVSTWAIVISIILGVGLGLLVTNVEVLRTNLTRWIALPGELYVRALRCLVVPMVFVSIAVAVAEACILGKRAMLGVRTIGAFVISSFISTVVGMSIALAFRHFFVSTTTTATQVITTPILTLKCQNGLLLETFANGSVSCSGSPMSSINSTQFQVQDINNVLLASTDSLSKPVSITNHIIAILEMVVTENIFNAFVNGTLLSVIGFAIPLGFAIVRSHNTTNDSTMRTNPLLLVLRQTRDALAILLHALIRITPIAIVFLISGTISNFKANSSTLSQVLILITAYLTSSVLHSIIALPIIFFIFTRTNPYRFMKHILPAYAFAFGCASSVATIPVVLAGIEQSRIVSRSLAHIVIGLGTAINMNAAGLYYPIMMVFMTSMSAIDMSALQLFVVFIMSFLGSMGTAPVPSAGLVMLLTVWKTVLPDQPIPPAFALLVAIDFLIDRISTVVNVHGNAMIARILANHFDEATFLWSDDRQSSSA